MESKDRFRAPAILDAQEHLRRASADLADGDIGNALDHMQEALVNTVFTIEDDEDDDERCEIIDAMNSRWRAF